MTNKMIMRYQIYLSFLLLFFSTAIWAQHTDTKAIRIVDTLTAQEKTARNPVLLESELDSLAQQWNLSQPIQLREPEKIVVDNANEYVLIGLSAIIALLVIVIYMFSRHQKKINRTIAGLNEKIKQPEVIPANALQAAAKDKKGKAIPQSLENRITDLNAELNKLSKENESLNRVITEYNGIKHEYDSLKHGILKTYKVKNYPGYDKSKDEVKAMQGVLETESMVAAYAYEKFLKPILTITDANKNSPGKINEAGHEKLLDLLISLSLLYIEYL